MSTTHETPVPAREAHETGQAPDTNPAADLETALAGLAYHGADFPLDFVDSMRRLLLPGIPAGEWDAYVEAVEVVHELRTGADPYPHGDANPAVTSVEAAREVALQEWQAAGDQALRFLVAAALRRYETLPATQESA